MLTRLVPGNTRNVRTVGEMMTIEPEGRGITDIWRYADLKTARKINLVPAGASGNDISGGVDADRCHGDTPWRKAT